MAECYYCNPWHCIEDKEMECDYEYYDFYPTRAQAVKKWNETAEARAAFGSWADRDDIGDDWLDELRKGWSGRLDELHEDAE